MAKPTNPQLPSPRIDHELAQRLDRLVEALNSRRELGAPEYAPTDVVRRLVVRALVAEEQELGLGPLPSPKKGTKPASKPKPRK